MKRFLMEYLEGWIANPRRKPLILRGARQVGKTYLIDKLGQSSFKYYLKANPERNPELKSVFEQNNPQIIINELSAIYNVPVIECETLIFIDEIQSLPEAIIALRYFYEDMPGLHIVAAGSLLDHTLNEIQYSMPVGRLEFAYLYPMNFPEFLIANGQEALYNYISLFDFDKLFSKAIHKKLVGWLRLYFFIGGMPEAVKAYVETQNLLEVEKIQQSILTSFKYDFAKYGSRKEQEYLNECLEYAGGNIGKKVKYSNINKNAHSRDLKEALIKLQLSRIIHLVYKTGSSKVPINQYQDKNIFKLLFLDIGLACNLAKIKLNEIQDIVTDFEGILAEQFIGQELISGFEPFEDAGLFYWLREKRGSGSEVDFLFQIGNHIFPIEVKAGKTGSLKSLHVYLAEKKQNKAVRFNLDLPSFGKDLTAKTNLNMENSSFEFDLYSLPLYLAAFIRKIVK